MTEPNKTIIDVAIFDEMFSLSHVMNSVSEWT